MATRAAKIAWAFDTHGPEGVYMDGEVSGKAADDHAVKLYDMAHRTGGFTTCPDCKGSGRDGTVDGGGTPYACRTCMTHGVVLESTGRPW
jgi:hypothetical protein